jgi:hypothetical protein
MELSVLRRVTSIKVYKTNLGVHSKWRERLKRDSTPTGRHIPDGGLNMQRAEELLILMESCYMVNGIVFPLSQMREKAGPPHPTQSGQKLRSQL